MSATITPEQDMLAATGAASSVSKALLLLEAMATSQQREFGVSELAAATALPKSTAHRLLKELADRGFVERSGLKYRVGSRFYELGAAAQGSELGLLREAAIPSLEWLFDRTAVTVNLAVLDGADVVYVEKITGVGGCRIPSHPGHRVPAVFTAAGKAILAHSHPSTVGAALEARPPRLTRYSTTDPRVLAEQLAAARQRGAAIEREEARLGVVAVAAPVLVAARPVAAVGLAGALGRFEPEGSIGLVDRAARQIARDLASSAPVR